MGWVVGWPKNALEHAQPPPAYIRSTLPLVHRVPVRPLAVPATVEGRLALAVLAEGRAVLAILDAAIWRRLWPRGWQQLCPSSFLARAWHGGLVFSLARRGWAGISISIFSLGHSKTCQYLQTRPTYLRLATISPLCLALSSPAPGLLLSLSATPVRLAPEEAVAK